jgi:shikimate O-hydroxycinnamoyltransferase
VGNRAILLNDAGARLVEATADVALGSLLPLEPTPELLDLHPASSGAEELMLVQVTRFPCGSFAMGTTAQHLVADGTGARAFTLNLDTKLCSSYPAID